MSQNYTLKIGDRLVRGKGILSKHHGIFVGLHNGQYWVAENNWPSGVRYVTYEQFLSGYQLERVEPFVGTEYQRSQIIPFINSKIGTAYDLATYNCEHFASEAQSGRPVSKQVQTAGALGVLVALIAIFGRA